MGVAGVVVVRVSYGRATVGAAAAGLRTVSRRGRRRQRIRPVRCP